MPLVIGSIFRDTLNGGNGNDTILGLGNLPFLFRPSEILNGNNGNDLILGDRTGGFTSAFAGPAGDDTLNGGNGNDTLEGDAGNDRLNGGTDNDSLIGGTGSDTVNGENGSDTIVWNNGDGSDTVNGGNGTDTQVVNGSTTDGDFFTVRAVGGTVDFDRTNLVPFQLTLDNVERLVVNGGNGNDRLIVLNNLSGTDLNGIVFTGGNGNDILDGSGSNTPIDASGGNNNDFLFGGGGNDTLSGDNGDDVLGGGGGNDLLNGGAGTDFITGGAGNDTLIGGLGRDTLAGGAGNDVFRYLSTAESPAGVANRDVIQGFSNFIGNDDRIDLSAIDARPLTPNVNDPFVFIGTAAFTAPGQVRAVNLGADKLIEVNTVGFFAGANPPEMQIVLAGGAGLTITASDFIL